MKLIVIVTGLVLLGSDAPNQRLHLFLPGTAGMAEPHEIFIRYPGAGGPILWRMENWALDLSSVARSGTARSPAGAVIDLEPHVRRIPRSWLLASPPPAHLSSRVTLPWPDSIVPGDRAYWRLRLGGASQRVWVTNRVRLVYTVATPDRPLWIRQRLRTNAWGSAVMPLPSPTVDSLKIDIRSVPRGGGTILSYGDEAAHFQGYFRAFGQGRWPRLFLDQRPRLDWKDPEWAPLGQPDIAGSPFNCMIAWAPVLP
jgi:hypothetical protein